MKKAEAKYMGRKQVQRKCEEENKGKENVKNLKVCVDQVEHHDTVFAPIVAHRDTFRGEPDKTDEEQAG